MNLPAEMKPTTARVWDKDFNFIGYVQQDALQPEEGKIALHRNDPVAQFLIKSEPPQMKWLTIEGPQGRWIGRLRESTWTSDQISPVVFTFEREPEHLRGWTMQKCQKCGEVLYAGQWLPVADAEDLLQAHSLTCEGRVP